MPCRHVTPIANILWRPPLILIKLQTRQLSVTLRVKESVGLIIVGVLLAIGLIGLGFYLCCCAQQQMLCNCFGSLRKRRAEQRRRQTARYFNEESSDIIFELPEPPSLLQAARRRTPSPNRHEDWTKLHLSALWYISLLYLRDICIYFCYWFLSVFRLVYIPCFISIK